ncbi:permease for cytosine/purines, uracil, thiamine, allantoin-domain-containing protein [Dichomitus squalens]|uniref:Permease for cytosine/purines, uracil, thiamine, allantoin-domain-containing protein n=1 Tax=Dichomitus squalens TaxID=114155 RepID=A0A4Q9MFR5_9APHY|nr:permease for cytosine/purines, uracil, thiamine, allantoin-domain-containing protein [Dichomitus squalens]
MSLLYSWALAKFVDLRSLTYSRTTNASLAYEVRNLGSKALELCRLALSALEKVAAYTRREARWSKKDGQRTWSTFNHIAYWVSDVTNAAVWELSSSTLAIGPSWHQILPAVGQIIISIVIALNGTVRTGLHTAFPVLNRSSFGFRFSYLSVVSRIVLFVFWSRIQAYTGSEGVYQMLKAI